MDQSEPGSRGRHCAEINTGCYRGQLTEEGSARLQGEGRNTELLTRSMKPEDMSPVAEETAPTRPESQVPSTTACSTQRVEELAQEPMSEQKVILHRVGPTGLQKQARDHRGSRPGEVLAQHLMA